MTDPIWSAKKSPHRNVVRESSRSESLAFADDVREERFVEHTLQIAVQAALDGDFPRARTNGGKRRAETGALRTVAATADRCRDRSFAARAGIRMVSFTATRASQAASRRPKNHLQISRRSSRARPTGMNL